MIHYPEESDKLFFSRLVDDPTSRTDLINTILRRHLGGTGNLPFGPQLRGLGFHRYPDGFYCVSCRNAQAETEYIFGILPAQWRMDYTTGIGSFQHSVIGPRQTTAECLARKIYLKK